MKYSAEAEWKQNVSFEAKYGECVIYSPSEKWAIQWNIAGGWVLSREISRSSFIFSHMALRFAKYPNTKTSTDLIRVCIFPLPKNSQSIVTVWTECFYNRRLINNWFDVTRVGESVMTYQNTKIATRKKGPGERMKKKPTRRKNGLIVFELFTRTCRTNEMKPNRRKKRSHKRLAKIIN